MVFLSALAVAVALAPRIAHATTQLSFFEHSSCNAGTSFEQYTDLNSLTADTSCHQLSEGTVALYVNQIDQGCTIRSYLSSNCDPSTSSLAGLLVSVGTCFYVDEGVSLGSWRPDCPGVDYSYTTGLDKSSSYSNSSSSSDPAVQSALATATGAVTLTAVTSTSTSTSTTSSSTSTSATDATVTPTGVAAETTDATTGTAKPSSTDTKTNGATAIASIISNLFVFGVIVLAGTLSGIF